MNPYREIGNITTVGLPLTTACNLSCPECFMNTANMNHPEHYDIEYIRYAAACLYGIEQVGISGGEPTAHPRFRELVPNLKAWFGCQELILVTNGYRLIESADVLQHFDQIFLSHFPHNQRQAKFLAQHFKDSRQPGPTLHVTTARRAEIPVPCFRAQTIRYVYGRVYPCCGVPCGYENIGIPLTSHWRKEIVSVPLPCAECCFAEEGDVAALTGMSTSHSETKPERVQNEGHAIKPAWRWPTPRPDIAIYGLSLDSWMGRYAEIRIRSSQGSMSLKLVFESHAPCHLHPLCLTFEDALGITVQTSRVSQPGQGEVLIPLRQINASSGEAWLTVRCTPTFIPQQLDANNPDCRELGIRVVSLRYT